MLPTKDSRVHLGLIRGAVALLIVPGVWSFFDPNVRSHPAAITALLGVALALLHWRRSAGGWRAAPLKFIVLLLAYGAIAVGAFLYADVPDLLFPSPLKLGPVLLICVVLFDLLLLSIKEPTADRDPMDRPRLLIAFVATWGCLVIFGAGFALDGGQGWASAFAGLSVWVSYLGFTQEWAGERAPSPSWEDTGRSARQQSRPGSASARRRSAAG